VVARQQEAACELYFPSVYYRDQR